MGSKNPKLRNKSGGTKSKNMPKGSPETTAKVMRAVQAVATGGKSEISGAIKKRLGKAGGGYMSEGQRKASFTQPKMKLIKGGSVRKAYGHGGMVNAMPKAKPC